MRLLQFKAAVDQLVFTEYLTLSDSASFHLFSTCHTSMSVLSVSLSTTHRFSKPAQASITLIANVGVKGDCHSGQTVQHRSRLHIQPAPPNLRQVHLIHSELLHEFRVPDQPGRTPYVVTPGQLGENITTAGIDLLALSAGTKLHFLPAGTTAISSTGEHPVVTVTGLRNPCLQIDHFQKGLKERCVVRDGTRSVVARKAGIMGVVDLGGVVVPGQCIIIEHPETFVPLECV